MADLTLTLDSPLTVASGDTVTFTPPAATFWDFGTPQFRIAGAATKIAVYDAATSIGLALNKPGVAYTDTRLAAPARIQLTAPTWPVVVTITKRAWWQRAFGIG